MMAKRDMPVHAHEPSPNVILSAHRADKTASDIRSQFLLMHWKPRFNFAHVPSGFPWQIIARGIESKACRTLLR